MVDFKRTSGLQNFTLGGGGQLGAVDANTTEITKADGTQPLKLDMGLGFDNRFDTFELGSTSTAPTTNVRLDAAIERFNGRMDTILGHDAMSMANGTMPYKAGDPLSDGQRDKMLDAAKDLMMEVPLDQLAPGLIDQVKGLVGADNMKGSSLKDLGEAGSTLAKNFVENMRNDSPALFYGLAGTAAVAAGAYGYSEGSQALRNLGLKPEFKTGLFNDRLEARASADWGPKFSDPSLELGMGANILLGRSSRLRAGATINTKGESSFSLEGGYQRGNFSASGEATIESDGDFRAGARARWQINDNAEFAASGSINNRGESRVGVGLKIKF